MIFSQPFPPPFASECHDDHCRMRNTTGECFLSPQALGTNAAPDQGTAQPARESRCSRPRARSGRARRNLTSPAIVILSEAERFSNRSAESKACPERGRRDPYERHLCLPRGRLARHCNNSRHLLNRSSNPSPESPIFHFLNLRANPTVRLVPPSQIELLIVVGQSFR